MQAYICLTSDQDGEQYWALATGDGVQEAFTLLAVGRAFTPGADIREAVAELETWARANGCELITPQYSVDEWSLQDLIEPEVFDDVFGDQGTP
ncbi:MAG TPA: hypothetical protein VHD90_19185 [Phototrophicaceae bacterium]|nr:hypothetical protein [Phototrophicaceae bacterium]